MRKGQNYISPVYFDSNNSEPLVLMAVPSINILGDFQGSLVAELNLISMWNLVNQLKVGNTGYAYVVNSQGSLIAFKNTNLVLKGENIKNIQSVNEFILHPVSNPTMATSTYMGLDGARVIGAYAPLGTPDWAVIVELPLEEAYLPVIEVIAASLGILLVMGILAGLMGVLIARRLAVPLVDLTNTATRIADGEMQLQATPSGAQEIVSLASAFNSMTAQLRELITNLEQRVADRTREVERHALRLRTAAEIARDIASASSLDDLLVRTGELIVDRFKFYHAGVFLLDDKKEYAVLCASPTEAGKQLIANSHRLRVGEQGIVGTVAAQGEARIALDVGADAVYFNNPYLPTTRSEMALPLKTVKEVFGVLDIQSDQPRAFVQEDIEIFQVMADQLAIAIERTRLLQRVESQLEEIERTYQESAQRSWRGFAHKQAKVAGYKFDGMQLHTINQPPDNPTKEVQTSRTSSLVTQPGTSGSQTIPIRLRGQTIGIVKLRARGDTIPKDTIAIVEQITERLAAALENARLTEETRRRAQRERAIAEVSTKISAYSDTDSIIRSAVEELGRRLGSATEVTLELGNDGQEQDHGQR
jgi:GAF domain-containing protein/HAMP domain-containing protein